MAQNIVISDGVSDHSSKVIETCNRPLLIKYSKDTGNEIPVLVQIDVEVKERIDGVFVFVKKGNSLVQGRDSDSDEDDPTFTFDISSILKSGIKKDIDFGLYTTANGANGINRKDNFPLIAEYRVKAKTWVINNDGVLEFNEDDSSVDTASNSLYFCDIEIPDDEVNSEKFSNTLPRTYKDSGWRLDANLSDKSFGKFLTNCPSNLRRTIPINTALSLSVFTENLGAGFQVVADYKDDTGSSVTADNLLTGNFLDANDEVIKTVNLTTSNTYLTANLSNTTVAGMGRDVDIYLKKAADEMKKLRFELINSPTTGAAAKLRTIEHYVIYFVNDYNCLDFYTFEGNLGVSHAHAKNIYKTGYKDYTKRDSSKYGVSRGRTDVVYTLSTIVNQEASEWLSEMYRSTNVFLLEHAADKTNTYVPIIITDADTVPLPQDRRNLEQFTISFTKDVHTVKQ